MRITHLVLVPAVGACAFFAPNTASAVSITLNAQSNVVQLDPTNSTVLSTIPGAATIQMSGNGSFGSLTGEVYDAGVVVYKDATGSLQYAPVPNNGSVVVSGSSYDHALLSDNSGQIVGNTGSNTLAELDSSNHPITSATITADGSTIPGPAALSTSNAAFFNGTLALQTYKVTASGLAFYDSVHEYGSVVVQYRDPTQGIAYDSLPIGTSRTYTGFNFRAWITDEAGQLGDNSGSITVDVSAVPEPSTLALAGFAATAALFRRRR